MLQKLLFIVLLTPLSSWAQDISELFEMNLEQLASLEVTTASKYNENWLNAPYATHVITQQKLKSRGINSLGQILQLIPGMLVVQQNNGIHNIHLRGLANLPVNGRFVGIANQTTLVMVDGQRLYNHFNGSSFWQTLPIQIQDIDRVEVVIGPLAALYGPNAVSGVIHFISKKTPQAPSIHLQGSQQGDHILSARTQQNGGKHSWGISAQQEQRERFDDQYWDWQSRSYLPKEQMPLLNVDGNTTNLSERFPDEDLAIDSRQLSLNYQYNGDWQAYVKASVVDSKFQHIYMEDNYTPYTTPNMLTHNIAAHLSYNNWQLQVHQRYGDYRLADLEILDFDFENQNLHLEYDGQTGNLRWRPGLDYEINRYTGEMFNNATASLESLGASLKLDWYYSDALRFTGAIRQDYYDNAKKQPPSFNLSGIYSTDLDSWRFSLAQVYQYPRFTSTFIHLDFTSATQIRKVRGNKDIDTTKISSIDFGWRHYGQSDWKLALDLFAMQSSNYSVDVVSVDASNVPVLVDVGFTTDDFKAQETGITLSAEKHWSQLEAKGSITAQTTELKNHITSTKEVVDQKHKGTPDFFASFSLLYTFNNHWQSYVNNYYLHDFQYGHRQAPLDQDPPSESKIKAQLITDIGVNYQLDDNIGLQFKAENIFADLMSNSRQYPYADEMESLFWIGANFEF